MPAKKSNSKVVHVPLINFGDFLGQQDHLYVASLWAEKGLSILPAYRVVQLCEGVKSEVEGGNRTHKWFRSERDMTDDEASDAVASLSSIISSLNFVVEEFNKEKKGNDKKKLFCFFES